MLQSNVTGIGNTLNPVQASAGRRRPEIPENWHPWAFSSPSWCWFPTFSSEKIKSSRPRHGSRTHRRPRPNYFWNSGPRPRLGRPVLRSSDPATETFVYNVRLSAVIESLFAFSSTRRWFLSVLVKFSNRWIFFIFSTKPLSRQDEKLEVRCRGGILKLSEQVICPQFSPS